MYAVILRHCFAGIISFLFGLYLVPIIIKAALKIGFMDAPDGRLKLQKTPVAYLGGVAIFIPFIATLGLCFPFDNYVLWLLLGVTLLLFVGLIDDLKVLKPSQKIFGQFLAALCFLKGGFSLKTPLLMSAINISASMFWLLTIINAFNLVDVMDGLCGTLAVCSATVFLLFALMQKAYTVSLLLTTFIGSVVAFLVYNKPSARIYLGDAGSMFIGGFLAAVPLLLTWEPSIFATSWHYAWYDAWLRPLCEVFFIPALVLGVPLLEVIGLFIIRTRLGIPFYNGSPHHFSIYLQKHGWSKWGVLFFSVQFSIGLALIAFMLAMRVVSFYVLFMSFVAVVMTWIQVVFLRKILPGN
ncbi:undecaprenyl/decaprenyl-phosphate alpha-N-acetylglucosaminyl 1-phosphate transferase [Candidatus Dependentiae bacterium]|nr:undecaprenyl/decaprenyl-phosphate alpha-N-acetylglucosaminyl 1-phosphate transferase [Candidatus Dependentiae bacterium]